MARNEAGQEYPFEPEGWVDLFFHWWFKLWEWLMQSFVPGLILGILAVGAIEMMAISTKMALLAAVPIAIALFLAQLFSHRRIWKEQFQLKLYHPGTSIAGIAGLIGLMLALAFESRFAGVIGGLGLGYFGGLLLGLFGGFLDERYQETSSY